jgi:hypothetical protein
MDRYYRHGDFQGNVLRLWRDYASESAAARGPCLTGECDVEIADYAMGEYLSARHKAFQDHPELEQGIELCCETRDDAEHMAFVMAQFTQETIPYTVTWRGQRVR